MKEDRKGTRISTKQFKDYKVRIDLDELTLEGMLGNISETGLCIMMRDDSLNDEVGTPITGAIINKVNGESLDFSGKIVWSKESQSNHIETEVYSGIEFDQSIVLTHALFIKSIEHQE
ncbi:PilZ domain-containing protein [Leptospira sp. GIMC2001]|uniref:PilZ domain-containing protein n=1 Tax=Leptospira sp. GIMC2001 TaxID=1513297 RepID=UPI00234A2DEB|nr:PilZ domain-containing protein [Leptospira sp. GIMC2001]WCL48827.1 PilZ domain-containing protein [Leptospira sp. GIMC2001]